MTHRDVSAEAADLEVGERAFVTAGGVAARVAAQALAHPLPGHFTVHLTGRALDGDGAPIADAHGRPIHVGPHVVAIHIDADTDLGAALEAARDLVLDRLDRAVAVSRALAGLAGVRVETLH